MTPDQLQQLDQRLRLWHACHADAARLRSAYRQKVLDFTLNSMELAGEPVDRERLQALLNRPNREPSR